MPRLIRTPEQIFREEGKDIYFLQFTVPEGDKDDEDDPFPMDFNTKEIRDAFEEMEDWFAKNTPDSRTEPMAPSEHSGFICGGPIALRVDFTPKDLKTFCAEWENAEGDSKDQRFQCYLFPYEWWYEAHGQFLPTLEQPTEPCLAMWIDTPIGIISYCFPPEQRERVKSTKAHGNIGPTIYDLWAHAKKLWPELEKVNFRQLVTGSVYYMADKPQPWTLVYTGRSFEPLDASVVSRYLSWFHLPEGAEAIDDYW